MEDESVAIDLDRTFESSEIFASYSPELHDTTIDLIISREHTLDKALELLHQEKYIIKNIRPKSGRLEEFFVRHTQA